MSTFKKFEKSLSVNAERLLRAATKALIPLKREDQALAQWSSVPGCLVGDALPKEEHWSRLHELLAANEGSKLVSGWCIESLRRCGVQKMMVLLERHTVLQMPSGDLLCPTTQIGHVIQFVNDPTRALDTEQYPAWNIAVYSNTNLPGLLGSLPAHNLGWTTNWGGNQAYSRDIRHAKWMAWGNGDPRKFIEAQGLSAQSMINLVLCSDLDDILSALHVQPHPSRLPHESVNALMKEIFAMHEKGLFQIKPAEVI